MSLFTFQYTETFNMFSVTQNIPVTFPPSFMGMWKVWLRFYINEKVIECVYFEGEIID